MVQPFLDHAVRGQRMSIDGLVAEMQWNPCFLLYTQHKSTLFLATDVGSKMSSLRDTDRTCAQV